MQAHSPPQPMPQMHPPPPQPYLGHHHAPGGPLAPGGPGYPLMPGATFCPPAPPGFPLGLAGGPARRKNATKETTALLKVWLNAHKTNPYPTKQEKVFLAVMSQMSMTQVSTWFANARRRLKKENKMTWAPRNRCDDDDDDEEEDDQISIDLDKEDMMDAQRESPQKPHHQQQQQQQQIVPTQTPPMQMHQHQQQPAAAAAAAAHQFPHLHPLHPHHPHHQLYSLMAAHHAAMQAAAMAAAQAQAQQHLQQHRPAQQQADSCGKHPFLWRPFA